LVKKMFVLIIQSCGVGFLLTGVTGGSDIDKREIIKDNKKNSHHSPRRIHPRSFMGLESHAIGSSKRHTY